MKTDRKKIVCRMFYRIPVTLASPLSISSGVNAETDHDVLVTKDGKPFITGASIAGAFRDYLCKYKPDDVVNELFGYIQPAQKKDEEQKGAMSRIFISDIVFNDAVMSVRDGIKLTEYKTTSGTAKFDYQIVEPSVSGILRLESVIYEQDALTEEDVKEAVRIMLSGVQNGSIRFGFKKNRGMGKLRVSETYEYRSFAFTKDSMAAEEYMAFLDDPSYSTESLTEWNASENDCIFMRVSLSLSGGISIRTYSAQPNAPDYSHLTSCIRDNKGKTKEMPVIPGSSWNGAIRARAFDLLKYELGCPGLTEELENVWGVHYTKDEKGNVIKTEYTASQIIFSESTLTGKAHLVRMTRNKINRFDASTVNTALYTERACFEGETQLEIMIKNKTNNQWIAGLLWLVLCDLQQGLLAVGGQTAVGRGIFCGEDLLPEDERKAYLNALRAKIGEVNQK